MRLKFDLSPRPVLVTGTVFILYLVLWLSTAFIQSVPPNRPSNADIKEMGFDLDTASQDLRRIASPSRPYNSRQNDVVRKYIMTRLESLKGEHSYLDTTMNQYGGSYWYDGESLTYFEPTNILFMISGTGNLKSIMFTAHYDSVATSYGATSSGIGVVTLLQLAAYFTTHRPNRTVILNFGNGEEGGLHGSRSYLLHSWFQSNDFFVNLGGFGSSGRPTLLRTSSHPLTRAFRGLPHSHGSALLSDILPAEIIQNSTGFSIFNAVGMTGIDLVFYQHRNRYHSFTDSIDSLNKLGGKEGAIWSMLSVAWGVVMANEDSDPKLGEAPKRTVYFDVFGGNMAVFTVNSLFAGNVTLLIFGPLALLAAYMLLLRSTRYRVLVEWIIKDPLRGWGRFWLSFILCVGLTLGFSLVHSAANPFIIASHPNIVVLCIFSLSLCSFCAPLYLLEFFRPLPSTITGSRQTTQTFLSLYVVWWIALLISTVLLRANKTGSLYFLTFFNAFALAAALIDLGAGVFCVILSIPVDKSETAERIDVLSYSTHEAPTSPRSHLENIDQAFWTRLLGLHYESVKEDILPTQYGLKSLMAADRYGLWLVEMVISLFFPVLLVMQLCLLLVNALSGTIVEGSSPTLVYLLLGAMIICTVLPLGPFAHRIHPLFYIALFLIFVVTIIYDNVAFPFTAEDRFKLFWAQSLNLNTGANKVEMVGLERYLPKIATRMTSTTNSTGFSGERDPVCGNFKCYKQLWDGPALKVVPNTPSTLWMNATVTRINATSARFVVRAERSKNCRFTFDRNISSLKLNPLPPPYVTPMHHAPYFPLPKGGTTKVTLWTRTESRNITADVSWNPSFTGYKDESSMVTKGQNVPRKVRVSCYHDDVARGKIPALDQAIDGAPEWVNIVGRQPLVEIYREFQL